jgi:valyl-tRNA synthetase
MKRFAFVVLLAAATVLPARPADDDLVTAAKAAKEKRKKSTTKVITNADVKKAKGKVVERDGASVPATDTAATPSLVEQYESGYRDRIVLDAKRAAAQKRVDELEQELTAVEQSYYEENDLDKRDKEIVKRFEEVKKELDQARGELEALHADVVGSRPSVPDRATARTTDN